MHAFADGDNLGRGHTRIQQCRKLGVRDLFRTGADLGDAGKGSGYSRAQEKCNAEDA